MSDLVARLRAALDEAERQARAATPGPWRYNPGKHWRPEGSVDFAEFIGAGPIGQTICVAATGEADDPQSMADAEFIAAWNPAQVLRLTMRDRGTLGHYERLVEARKPGAEVLGFQIGRLASFWLEDGE